MTAAKALQAAYSAGVAIRLDGDKLHLKASAPPPAKVVEALKQHKAAIIELFRRPYADALARLEARCPDYVPEDRWRQCIDDAHRLLAEWSDQAYALGWAADELFGLHEPPTKPHPLYSRLSRYDARGLIWGLEGRRVIALSSDTAAVATPSGGTLTYRKHNKPAFGPMGDLLDDFKP
jgi:hypothetical protein